MDSLYRSRGQSLFYSWVLGPSFGLFRKFSTFTTKNPTNKTTGGEDSVVSPTRMSITFDAPLGVEKPLKRTLKVYDQRRLMYIWYHMAR